MFEDIIKANKHMPIFDTSSIPISGAILTLSNMIYPKNLTLTGSNGKTVEFNAVDNSVSLDEFLNNLIEAFLAIVNTKSLDHFTKNDIKVSIGP